MFVPWFSPFSFLPVFLFHHGRCKKAKDKQRSAMYGVGTSFVSVSADVVWMFYPYILSLTSNFRITPDCALTDNAKGSSLVITSLNELPVNKSVNL